MTELYAAIIDVAHGLQRTHPGNHSIWDVVEPLRPVYDIDNRDLPDLARRFNRDFPNNKLLVRPRSPKSSYGPSGDTMERLKAYLAKKLGLLEQVVNRAKVHQLEPSLTCLCIQRICSEMRVEGGYQVSSWARPLLARLFNEQYAGDGLRFNTRSISC